MLRKMGLDRALPETKKFVAALKSSLAKKGDAISSV